MRQALLLFPALLALATPARGQAPADTLRAPLERRIASAGAVVGLYFRDLTRADSLAIGADRRFHAASTMKVPVMVQVFRDADAGRLDLNERLVVTDSFRSLADSSVYRLSAADDSDSSLYRRVGDAVRVFELVELMITVSSNLATNNLIARVGAGRVQATMALLGADSVRVLRGVEDGPAFRAGMNNTTTARGLGNLMAQIADGLAASAHASGRMLEILLRQSFNDGIPAGLPRNTRVAHKTGEITGAHHDAAVVYIRNRPRYVLVILTQGLTERAASARLMADLTALIHAHVTGPGGR